MSFYPLFIPMYSGGGGGSGKSMLILLGATVGGWYLFIDLITRPKYQMKMMSDSPSSANIQIRRNIISGYGDIHTIKHKNIEELKKKGYSVYEDKDNKYICSYTWHRFVSLETVDRTDKFYPKEIDLPKDKLIADCKECDVYTEIIYRYNNVFGNEKYDKQKLYWHKNFKEELQ